MHTANSTTRRPGTMAIAILGADTMLAALPATPVQVAHACLAAGYGVAVPASWGDELLATECLRQLAERGPRPAVMCACPLVRSELLAAGPDLAPVLVSLVPPPVAVARYLHALYGRDRLHLTYIGACPGAQDDAIDDSESPDQFFSRLRDADIALADQPRVFDSVIPPDRRRFCSIAGGVPSAEQLWSVGNGRSLIELDGEDFLIDLAQHLLSHQCALIDLAPRLGCACSGASAAIPARSARAAVAVVEPPRAASAVIDVTIAVDVLQPIEMGPALRGGESSEALSREMGRGRTAADLSHVGQGAAAAASGDGPMGRQRTGAIGTRTLQQAVPTTRVNGRALPRAYVARRRMTPVHAIAHVAPVAPVARVTAVADRSVTRAPVNPAPEPVADDHPRVRQPARVPSPRSHEDRGAPISIVASSSGTPEKMGDGPRS